MMQENNLVVTRADSKIKEMTDLTHPIIKKFADEWGADFSVLSHDPPFLTDDKLPHYRILKVKELLDTYDRVVVIDSDVVINKNCPNLFEVVPKEKIGVIYEDKGSRRPARHKVIKDIQKKFGDIGWKENYINDGVIVISREHRIIFEPINQQYWTGWGSDDGHFGYQINKHKIPVHELSFRFNHMSMFSEPWNNRADRRKSYILHYAGGKIKNRIHTIKQDIRHIYG